MKRNLVFPFAVVMGLSACGGSDDAVEVMPEPVNQAPAINFSIPETTFEKSSVNLNSGATDTDGSISSYLWSQTAGPDVEFNAESASIEFVAPNVTETTTLTFELTVTDDDGATTSQSVSLDIQRVELEIALVGQVVPERYANGIVDLTYGIDSAQGDISSDGSYSVIIKIDDDTPETTVAKLVARADADDPVTLVVLQPRQFGPLTGGEQAVSSNSVIQQDVQATGGPDISVMTTAAYSIMLNANGGEEITDEDVLTEVEQQVSVDVLLETAAVAQLVVEGTVALPEGSSDMSELLADNSSYNELVTEIETESPGIIADTATEIAEDPANLPDVDPNDLPSTFYIGEAAAPTFVNRGTAGKYSLNANGQGSAITSRGGISFDWSTEGNRIILENIDAPASTYFPVINESLGFSSEEVSILLSNGYFQIQVDTTPLVEEWSLLSEGARVDSYRVKRTTLTQSELITIDGVNYQSSTTDEGIYDWHLVKSTPEEFVFSEEMLSSDWVLPIYSNEDSASTYKMLGERVTFTADGKGSTGFTEKSFTWTIDTGKLRMQFLDFSQELTITSRVNSDIGVSVTVETSDLQFIKAELASAYSTPDTVNFDTGAEKYWQTTINNWNLISWDGERLKACWDESSYDACYNSYWSLFGFQLNGDAGVKVQSWESPLEIDWDFSSPLSLIKDNGKLTMNHDYSGCGLPNDSVCRYREWELVKVTEGRLGRRIYVLEYDERTTNYNGQTSVVSIGPRINMYEEIDIDYFKTTAPENLQPNTSNTLLNSIGRLTVAPSNSAQPDGTR
ncbi:hypothetical protein L2725_01810 [Shewanella corallii]|uniref:PKD/Chitinase domain-containing protein n=1 Tax=Shewanella corallii TaxID=560080 RepID=A0ABT0N276_9GAMM|nr:hypothetical protein [Shewanella corallii]MCL2912529.1 hypothetical protein [Shewanella corallii]